MGALKKDGYPTSCMDGEYGELEAVFMAVVV